METLTQPSLAVAIAELLVGIVVLAKAADAFVEGAADVAKNLRMSPVVIGAVIIGFGTSVPELLVSSLAAVNGDLALGVGNVVGSNVANLSLVLGVTALVVSLVVSPSVLAREAPLSLLAVLLFGYFTGNGLARWEGVVLLIALAASLSWILAGGRTHAPNLITLDDVPGADGAGLRTAIGLIGTVVGAQLLVWGASGLAAAAGLTGGFIGFTLVAVGTSLPELVTAVVAARKGETELILGNLLGSNMFNSLAVGGAIAVLHPGPIGDATLTTIGVGSMVAVAVISWFFMVTRRKVYRLEGSALLLIWIVAISLMAPGSTTSAAAVFGIGG